MALKVFPWANERLGDVGLYASYAQAMVHGAFPYRDFFFEYPPLAAPTLAVGGLAGDSYTAYRHAFIAMIFLVGLGLIFLTRSAARKTGGNESVAVLGVAVSPLLLGAILRTHFDLVPIALTLAALIIILHDRVRLGAAVLGLAIAVKGFPIVVAIVVLAWLWGRRGRRIAAEALLVLIAIGAVVGGASFAASPHGLLHMLRFQLGRPVEIESTPASALVLLGHLGFAYPRVIYAARSWGLSAPASGVVTALTESLGALVILVIAWRVHRRPGPRELILGSFGAILAFMAFGKVVSPQYLVWTIPVFALSMAWREWRLAIASGGAMLLTLVEFPSHFLTLVVGSPTWLAEVGIRNLLLLSATLLCFRAIERRRADLPLAHVPRRKRLASALATARSLS